MADSEVLNEVSQWCAFPFVDAGVATEDSRPALGGAVLGFFAGEKPGACILYSRFSGSARHLPRLAIFADKFHLQPMLLALATGTHRRLGAQSPVFALPEQTDILAPIDWGDKFHDCM
jgi:hypothetical protein